MHHPDGDRELSREFNPMAPDPEGFDATILPRESDVGTTIFGGLTPSDFGPESGPLGEDHTPCA